MWHDLKSRRRPVVPVNGRTEVRNVGKEWMTKIWLCYAKCVVDRILRTSSLCKSKDQNPLT
ncbi:hypothetical protein PILCRDRAFT_814694 [Piloderma croceum F 1598]|uniref:Uncharacterized protein n=1 Tax=Piloderma croceum (strain F 1598) TaxID=765440 RepID=A0A0C3BNF9_PILCF|nr:hypothetical protein PILCRDRAFT_814694 [Piloderma croceum F 1598]